MIPTNALTEPSAEERERMIRGLGASLAPRTCSTCRHWWQDPPSSRPSYREQRPCRLLSSDGAYDYGMSPIRERAHEVAWIHTSEEATLFTDASFGCALWEART